MPLFNIPLSAFGFCYILSVLVSDLTFDLQTDSQITLSYYIGLKQAIFPLSQMINISILLAFIPLIINLISLRKVYDILTFIVSFPAFFIFVLILIPNQDKLRSMKGNDDLSMYFEVNTFWHKILFVQMVFSIFLQILARKENPKTKHE